MESMSIDASPESSIPARNPAQKPSFSNDLDEFAHALEQSRGNPASDGVLELYQTISSEKAKNAFDKDHKEFENSELESRLWSLVRNLYGFRLNEKEQDIETHPYNGDAVLQEKYLRKHPKSRELWLIVEWLHDSMIMPDEPLDLRGSKWLYTKGEIKKLRLNKFSSSLRPPANAPRRSSVLAPRPEEDLVSHLDPDAPFRENKGIAKDDEDYERSLYGYIFHLILGSHYEAAMKVCEKTSNWTLKMAIRGVYGYIDPEIDAPVLGIHSNKDSSTENMGIERKALWRRMCYQMAKQTNHIDPYERGIYGLLANDLASVLDLCDTWESQLLAYLSHMLAEDSEKPLVEAGRIGPELKRLDVPRTKLSTVQSALDVLAHSTNPVVKQQSENLLRNLIGAVINDTVELIINQLAQELEQLLNGKSDSPLVDMPYIIRVSTHLILYLQNQGKHAGNDDSIATVVQAYIQILCHEDKSHLVPLYVSYLPHDLANKTYSALLADISDLDERRQHLHLGKKYHLDMDNMVRLAVERVFKESPSQYQPQPVGVLDTEVSEEDVRLYNAVEWYITASLHADAVHASVFLFRRFLMCGKVESAKAFGSSVSLSTMLKKYDAWAVTSSASGGSGSIVISESNRLEIMEYDRFLACLADITSWNEHYAQLVESASTYPPTSRDTTRSWQSQALEIVDQVSQQVYDLCDNWLLELLEPYKYFEENSSDWIAIHHIRSTFVPHLLLELAKILIEAQVIHSKFLKQAVELANLVASDDSKLYQYFIDGNMLQPFLEKIATAFTDGVSDGERGIYE